MEWVAVPSSRGSPWPRDQTHVLSLLRWLACSLPLAPSGKPAKETNIIASADCFDMVSRAWCWKGTWAEADCLPEFGRWTWESGMAGVVGIYRTKHRRGESCREGERQGDREERQRERANSREMQKVLAESSAKCWLVRACEEARWGWRKYDWARIKEIILGDHTGLGTVPAPINQRRKPHDSWDVVDIESVAGQNEGKASVYIAVLDLITPNWKQLSCSSVDEL